MDDFLQELKATFIEELSETIDSLEQAFLEFEKNPTDKDLIHSIFRNFHNIKGSAKTVGLKDLAEFAHKTENLLAKLREGELSLSAKMSDCLLGSTDHLRRYCELVLNGQESDEDLLEAARLAEGFLSANDTAHSLSPTQDENVVAEEHQPAFQVFDDDDPMASDEVLADEIPAGAATVAPPPLKEMEPKVGVPVETEQQDAAEPNGDGSEGKKLRTIEESMKIPMGRINNLLDLFGEQVILQSTLDHSMEKEDIDREFISQTVNSLKKITMDLQHTIVSLRMINLTTFFNRMERSIRDVTKQTGKKVNFSKIGINNELDKTIVDTLIDPMTHMVRNAVDHGIESPEERKRIGKPEVGTVKLLAKRVGGSFVIELIDDGKGLDKDKIYQKAVRLGLIPPNKDLKEEEIHNLIFEGGFSTLDQATDISGRGVGMDVVRRKIQDLKGTCKITSKLGEGTKFIIRLPLSLSMFNGTVVQILSERYVIANSDYREALPINLTKLKNVNQSRQVIRIKDNVYDVIDLRQLFKIVQPAASHNQDSEALALIVEHESKEYALLINDILSQEQIVLKQLGPETKRVPGASGGTILGDGRVALVLDVAALVKRFTDNMKVA